MPIMNKKGILKIDKTTPNSPVKISRLASSCLSVTGYEFPQLIFSNKPAHLKYNILEGQLKCTRSLVL